MILCLLERGPVIAGGYLALNLSVTLISQMAQMPNGSAKNPAQCVNNKVSKEVQFTNPKEGNKKSRIKNPMSKVQMGNK